MSGKQIISSFLLSNLHCPSCVSHIKDVLSELDPQPESVSPSLVTSWVTIHHEDSLSIAALKKTLEQEGFDVCDMTTDSKRPETNHYATSNTDIGYLDRFIENFPSDVHLPARSKHSSRHILNCEACRANGTAHPGGGLSPKGPQSSFVEHAGEEKQKTGKENGFVVVDSIAREIFRASLAVGGMTCASCVGTIADELQKKDWVEKVVINLISNSATVDFTGEEHKDDVVACIEDIGYDATLDNVVSLKQLQQPSGKNVVRTVEIKVEGMFCQHCPDKVLDSLKCWGDRVEVEGPLTLQKPILKISYIPQAPNFTIRKIIESISDVEATFGPAIYHPPTLEERSRKIHRREQLRILIRVIVTLIISVPTLIIGIIYMSLISEHNAGRMFLMHPLRAGISRAQWALFIMATPVYFLCADVFHVRALKEIRTMWRPGSKTPILHRLVRFGSMNMLMSLGTSIAYISSTSQLIAAGVNPSAAPDDSTFYFDSVVFLTLFLLIGRLIESYSKSKTGDAVTMLGKLRPTEASLVIPGASDAESINGTISSENIAAGHKFGTQKKINVDLLEFGDVVRILHGGSPPCDGIIVEGDTKFDESSLTGESRLVRKSVGDEVFSGTVNKDSPISVKITGVAGSSMLDQIVKAVREGQTRRAPIERIADLLTSYFVPAVTLIAIVTWIVWLSLGVSGTLPQDWQASSRGGWVSWSLQFSIAVFVVACPCGLALAAPTALFVGGGIAAQHGILVKGGGEAFEKASRLDCIVFDKTGTLTIGGEPVVTDFKILPTDFSLANGEENEGESQKTILGMASAIEDNSSHTVAKAIKTFCTARDAARTDVDHVEEVAGKGMEGTFKRGSTNVRMLIGNELLLLENNVTISEATQSILNSWKSEGKSVALAAIQTTTSASYLLAVVFAISDPIRPEAHSIIQGLQSRGTQVWMLSGDNEITAKAIGAQVGIPTSNIIAGVLPSQKAEKIQYLQRSLKSTTISGTEHPNKRAIVAMVGDGINDSPALTTADVGIAVGSGSDIAISSAEFVLVSSNLNTLITLLDLSKGVFRRIKFNFAWALVYNMIALPVAAGVLYPVVTGSGKHVRLDPVWASLAMAASSISVVCSSLLLRSKVPGVGFRVRDVKELHESGG